MKFRCSSLGNIMTNPRSKSEMISETAKAVILEQFIQDKYGRTKDVETRYMEKGLKTEDDSITLYSRLQKTFFVKNDQRLSNNYITGEPDAFIGKSIDKADIVLDFKSSWDLWTFWKAKMNDVNKQYFWQMQGYMWLTGAKEARLIYCLNDTPESLILAEKKRLWYKLDVIDEMASPEYIEGSKEIERNMTFGDIPIQERCFETRISRDVDAIKSIQGRVELCREWVRENLPSSPF